MNRWCLKAATVKITQQENKKQLKHCPAEDLLDEMNILQSVGVPDKQLSVICSDLKYSCKRLLGSQNLWSTDAMIYTWV